MAERLLWASTTPAMSGGEKIRGMGAMGTLVGQLGELLSRAVMPPPPRVCGTPGGPPVTAPRVRLSDGRHLAYEESGVPKEAARYKIVFSHGFTGSRLDSLRASPEVAEELGVYMVAFDRAGYGESDPNPNRTVKSAALDMAELADALGLGDKFYVVGVSLGSHAVWGALRYIPERIAGAVMMAPVVNYWWPGFPAEAAAAAYGRQSYGDQWALRVSHHAPAILHWWMDQSWLPTSTVGINESYYRDMTVMFGKWEFDPMALPEPPCPVHIWQGDEDGLVPVALQRHVAGKLGWVNYHELPGTGHFLSAVPGLGDTVGC
uniref:AB hydrolase-1 domain-containing protein n=1 Tax=Oryza punctata TaxID=4537 RepID=A0A0E0M9V6_ORYPU